MDIKWTFPSNNYGVHSGISDSGIESFKTKPIASLAREVCQNSLDAGIKLGKVRIEFDMFTIKRSDFPNVDEFSNILTQCVKSWKSEKNQKTVNILKKAKSEIEKPELTFLRISDFNTTGLRGSDKQRDSEWHNLVKSSGSSDKSGTTGGSFGIGKNATFVCSEFRTVFYSTLDIDGKQAYQGVAKLVSFNLNDPEQPTLESQGTGYFGLTDKLMPIKECISLQENYHRTEPGTDIFIAGYKAEFIPNWENLILKEVLDNYFYALHQGTLEIKISDILVNKQTLKSVYEKYSANLNPSTRDYFNVLYSDLTVWETVDFKEYGNIKSGFLIGGSELQRKVAMIRYPWMKIKDQDRVYEGIPFAGILIIEGEELNSHLRRLENPTHTKWDPEQIDNDPSFKSVAKSIIKDLKNYLVDRLLEIAGNQSGEAFELEATADLIPLEEEDQNSKQSDVETLQPGIKEVEIKKQKKIKSTSGKEPAGDSEVFDAALGSFIEGEGVGIPEHGNGKQGISPAGGDKQAAITDGDTLINQPIAVTTEFAKFMCVNKKDKHFRVLFKPQFSAENCILTLNKLDEQNVRVPVRLIKAFQSDVKLETKGNKILGFKSVKEKIHSIDFIVNEPDYFSLEVQLHGSQL